MGSYIAYYNGRYCYSMYVNDVNGKTLTMAAEISAAINM